jgi:tryptophan synthase alpha chain
MNRLDRLFAEKKKEVLGVYFTAGFPVGNHAVDMVCDLAEAGVDFVEVGMPFSDPLADGPVIQESSSVALKNGMTISKLFGELKALRNRTDVPVVLMGYVNPVMQFGFEKFLSECRMSGVDAVILPDLPVEVYVAEYKQLFLQYEIYPVFLISPQTPADRATFIANESKGFIYLVSSSATTGANGELSTEQQTRLKQTISAVPNIPVMVGFGIHDSVSFSAATKYSAGGIVGSAFIRALGTDPKNAIETTIRKIKPELYDHSASR